MRIAFCLLFILVSTASYAQKEKTPPFRIKEHRAWIGGQLSDTISKSDIAVQSGVGAEFRVTEDHWERMTVLNFKLCIYRDSVFLSPLKNHSNIFNSEIKNALKELRSGDKVLVFDIYASGPDGKERLLNPLQYIIK